MRLLANVAALSIAGLVLLAPGSIAAPRLLITPTAIAGVRIGDSEARAVRLLGRPYESFGRGAGGRYLNFRIGGAHIQVGVTRQRVVEVNVNPLGRFRTSAGDRDGTPEAIVRAHWPRARRIRACCSGTVAYVLRSRPGYFLMLHVFATHAGDRPAFHSARLTTARAVECFEFECSG